MVAIRYDSPLGYMDENLEGEYVHWENYERLLKRVEELAEQLRIAEASFTDSNRLGDMWAEKLDKARKRIEELEFRLSTDVQNERVEELEKKYYDKCESLLQTEEVLSQLRVDLKLNAHMLAKQTDLARVAETRLAKLIKTVQVHSPSCFNYRLLQDALDEIKE